MTNKLNTFSWLVEQDIPAMGGQPDMGAGQPPTTQPGAPGDPMGTGGQIASTPTDMATDPMAGMDDISSDPQFPEMPEETGGDDSFQIWQMKYVKESIKGDPNVLTAMIMKIRDRDLSEPHEKFVEDNLQIQFIRQNANIFEASQELRKLIKKELDRSHPGKTLVNHIFTVLQRYPLLVEVFIKIGGTHGAKGDAHRKFISALIGGVQLASGQKSADVVFEEVDYSIRISTRFNARWGDVNLGNWMLKEDDPERYLKSAEMDRLEGGSPEEKDVLRRRVIVESIAEMFKERGFIINVVGSDGTVYHVGWDFGTSLKQAFLDGKLVVRTGDDKSGKDAFIDENGVITTIPPMSIYYVRETGELASRGRPETEEVEFIQHRDGMLFLTAQLDLIQEAAMSMQGLVLQENPWQGNPSDLKRVKRCVPSVSESILRQC